MWNIFEQEKLKNLKFIKKQIYDRHIKIWLGHNFIDDCHVLIDDDNIIKLDNSQKNKLIDLLIDTTINYLEGLNDKKNNEK